MPAITIEQLNDAAADVTHIAEFTTSAAPTTTDRLGQTKPTLHALIDDTSGSLTALVDEATTARDDAQAQAGAIAATVIGGRRTDTWAALSAITGLATGAPGEVTNDTGTHVDPVTAATVANDGFYTYVNPTGWKWAGSRDISSLKTAAAALADDVEPTTDDGTAYLVASTDGETVLAVDGSERLVGTAVDNLGVRPWEPWRDDLLRLATAPVVYRSGEGWNHVIFWGQSNALGSADGDPAISTTQPYSNLTFIGGTRSDGTSGGWAATKPLITEVVPPSANSEDPSAGATENAVNYAARKHGIPTANLIMFGSVAAQGATGIDGVDKPSTVYTRILDQVTNAKALATAAGKSYNCVAVAMMEGESNFFPTPTGRADFSSKLTQFIADLNTDIKAIKVPQDPVHLLVSQLSYGAATTLANNISLAHMDVIQSNPLAHLSHPTYFLPHDQDDTHRSNIGHKWEGAYFGRAWGQIALEGRKPDCLMPLGGFANGTELRIRFRVPTYPLKFEIGGGPFNGWQKVTDYGIKVVDDTGTLTLSNIHVENGDEIVCTLNRTLGTNPRLRLGLDYLAWNLGAGDSGIQSGAMTNIRDSSRETFVITWMGTTYTLPMYHWCPHFEGAISILVS